jgi:hypothetical protein
MARPRKIGKRKPCGRLIQDKEDKRFSTAEYRTRDFGVKGRQIISPLAGYLAGVLYMRGQIDVMHLGHFFSFLQLTPHTAQAIQVSERVQGGHRRSEPTLSRKYMRLNRKLGFLRMKHLHELSHDRLVCPVNTLKQTLELVPLTSPGVAFMNWCETHHPRSIA